MDRSLVSITFDDGLRCQFERAVPILDQHALPATFFLVANTDPIHTDGIKHPDWPKTTWSTEDIQFLKGMIRQGHEIGSHSVTHRSAKVYRGDDAKFEAEKSKEWIETRLGIEVSSYCYPFCHITDDIKNAVMNAKYKQARWGLFRNYRPQKRRVDLFKVDCRHIAKDNALSVVIDNVEYDVGRDGSEDVKGWLQSDWYVLMYHGIGTIDDGWWPISVAEFSRQMAELAKLRDSGAVEVVTFKDGADRERNNPHQPQSRGFWRTLLTGAK